MRCRRICRELLWLARFGEFGPSSQPHLDHLANCQGCRDEVGYDREMVRQLRIALRARIEAMEPSPRAWEAILERAKAPEPIGLDAWWRRWAAVASRLRTATAMAGTGLALVLALNTQVIPTPAVEDSDAGAEPGRSALQQVPRLPTGRTALVAYMRQSAAQGATNVPDVESVFTGASARLGPPPPAAASTLEEEEASTQLRVVIRPIGSPAPTFADSVDGGSASGAAPGPEAARAADAVTMEPGEPS
jgi:hypothetical protein